MHFASKTKLFQREFVTREEELKAYDKLTERVLELDTRAEDAKIKMVANDDYVIEDAF